MLLVLRPQKLHAKVRHRYSFQTRLPDPESVKIIEYRYQGPKQNKRVILTNHSILTRSQNRLERAVKL
jgi:hypothetical protein